MIFDVSNIRVIELGAGDVLIGDANVLISSLHSEDKSGGVLPAVVIKNGGEPRTIGQDYEGVGPWRPEGPAVAITFANLASFQVFFEAMQCVKTKLDNQGL